MAALRRAAGFSTQQRLATAVGCGRSTVANAESGHPWVTLRFWARCDELLHSDGWLVRGYRGVLQIEDQMRLDERAERTARAAHRAMQALALDPIGPDVISAATGGALGPVEAAAVELQFVIRAVKQALTATAAGCAEAQPDVAVLNRRVPVRLRLQQAEVRAEAALRLLRISARQNAAGRESS